VATKCDFCLDRWTEKKKPICVDACPMHALDAGPLNEMEELYVGVKDAIGFESSREIAPSVVFKSSSRKGKNPAS